MKKELRNQIEQFVEYNIELRRLSEENFADKRKKDIVSFWISCINFELYFMESSGIFQYDSSKLSYGLDEIKLDLKELTNEELDEIINYYWRKGYILNQHKNIVLEKSETIVIDWSKPNRQNLKDKIYILKFKCSKFEKLFIINNQENPFLKSIFFTIKDFYWYYFWNHSYCINAIRAYRKSSKSKKAIEIRKNIRKIRTKNQ